jgi:asparaginyl-tRNA synthetase
MTIKQIYTSYKTLLDKPLNVCGWASAVRNQAETCFITISDGSCSKHLQIVIGKSMDTVKLKSLCIGTSIRCSGTLVVSPAKGQLFELRASEDDLIIEGKVENDYPIIKTNLSFEHLRNYPHLRARTKTFSSIFRIRHSMLMATHAFYNAEDFLLLDPNIITTGECEGGAGVFQITEHDISIPSSLNTVSERSKEYDWSKDHFGRPVYLTVSSQLQLEALAMSMGRVYTLNKSFRSEHSNTHKHASEFTHLEIEQCFTSFDDLISIAERFIKYVMKYVLDNNSDDLEILEKSAKFNDSIDKELFSRYKNIIESEFVKIKYRDAIEMMRANPKGLVKIPVYGEDIGSEHEKYLTTHFGCPVFLTHWPISVKSFYMKQTNDGSGECESFDLLMPYGVGELIGASQRETDYSKLISIMELKGVSKEPLEFYTDLRKYGSCEHGGFGLGMDRLLMLITGVHNIRDVIPFPVMYGSLNY